uniref:Mitochondrial outer membrane protein porin of 34 kDa n=1 Tax=Tanacetum cinerariifolium TaxID=118510 RepID=A0A6L2K401_TANCI|nr:mitochondrial outer membrane protein porin of 34 kDa [Tanacetum cinerariifolium]
MALVSTSAETVKRDLGRHSCWIRAFALPRLLYLAFTVVNGSKACWLSTTITVDEPAPGLKAILSFKVPDQRSGKLELQYLHDHAGISTSVGLTANPIINFSGVFGTNVAALGTDVSFDTRTSAFTKYNAGITYSNADVIAALTL